MSNIIIEPMEAYRARKAMSAGMAWRMVNECPLLAWHHSPFNPARPAENRREFDIGTAAHLAILEPDKFRDRIAVIEFADYKTKEARKQRDECYANDVVPLREQDHELVHRIGHMIEMQCNLFAGGTSEATYVWDWNGVPCKARVDYLANRRPQGMLLIDLKTANSSSPAAFQRAMLRDGHHLRAAWYLDGYLHSVATDDKVSYRYVVVSKDEPHIVSEFEVGERSLEWGRRLYRRALKLFAECEKYESWPRYDRKFSFGVPSLRDHVMNVELPAHAEYALADMEAGGEL